GRRLAGHCARLALHSVPNGEAYLAPNPSRPTRDTSTDTEASQKTLASRLVGIAEPKTMGAKIAPFTSDLWNRDEPRKFLVDLRVELEAWWSVVFGRVGSYLSAGFSSR